ncbi:MAG TPA: hypothetical protein VMS43_00655 [Allosphingosinicella sp.]|nr:hypothetical protein [Allosphingosinicella sp.]
MSNAGEGAWRLSDLADMATALGVPIGLLAFLLGLLTLLSSARTARLQHMHDMFRDYLKLQFEYNKAVGDGNSSRKELRKNLGGFKMYSLEEMTLWLRRERVWGRVYFWSSFHREHVKTWQDTINWHLDDSSYQDFADVEAAIECYGPDFLDAVEASKDRRPRPAPSAQAMPAEPPR